MTLIGVMVVVVHVTFSLSWECLMCVCIYVGWAPGPHCRQHAGEREGGPDEPQCTGERVGQGERSVKKDRSPSALQGSSCRHGQCVFSNQHLPLVMGTEKILSSTVFPFYCAVDSLSWGVYGAICIHRWEIPRLRGRTPNAVFARTTAGTWPNCWNKRTRRRCFASMWNSCPRRRGFSLGDCWKRHIRYDVCVYCVWLWVDADCQSKRASQLRVLCAAKSLFTSHIVISG